MTFKFAIISTLFKNKLACLRKLEKCPNKEEGIRAMYSMAVSRFALPGESAFPLSHFYGPAKSTGETEDLRKYLTQFRREIGFRSVFCIKLTNSTDSEFECGNPMSSKMVD
jgi:hypothetical protein